MAEVLAQNTQLNITPSEHPNANRHSGLARSLLFKYYIHDSLATLRFQLIGDLRVANLLELDGSWKTARTTLNSRGFVLDVSQLYSTDEESRKWLLKMKDSGAVFHPSNYQETALRSTTLPTPEQVAAVKLSILGRVMGMIRGI